VTTSIATNQTILVVGGGIGGMTAALEAAERGKQVMLANRNLKVMTQSWPCLWFTILS
jgi:quinone-modifying oxidoreductase, subunit QmoA